MSNTFSIFSRGLDGINVNMRRLATTANNIANMNTAGYSRQRVDVGARQSEGIEGIGGGVEVLGVQNSVDRFLELQLFTIANNRGTLEGRKNAVQSLEGLVNEAQGTGLSKSLNEFFNGFRELENRPMEPAVRMTVRERARNLISQFKEKSAQLKNMLKTTSDEIDTRLTSVNGYLSEIASLNKSIAQQELGGGGKAFELRDRRTYVLRELSGEMNCNFYENPDGQVNIYLADGSNCVTGSNAGSFSLSDTVGAGTTATINLTNPNGNSTVDVTNGITGGAIGGNLYERNTQINGMLTKLDDLAYTLCDEVNKLHFNGYGLNGATHNNFFTTLASATDAAGNLDLDASIVNDPRNIAAASSDPLSTSGPGNQEVAKQIADLENGKVMNGNSETMAEFYRNMIADVGVDSKDLQSTLETQENLYNATLQQREAISGVSENEEGADLIRFQRAFEASVRIMTVGSQLLETILNL